jgi:hypothetical protein
MRGSVLGEAGGETMVSRKSMWEAAKIPRQLFCESRSWRGRGEFCAHPSTSLICEQMMIELFVDAGSFGNRGSNL